MKTRPSSTKSNGKNKGNEQLKTEPPISEKDEVKKAEDRSKVAAKKKL